jgi:hypothetical protein
MDEPLRYEHLIGEKLQSLPIPNLQDAIWARVKEQLDLDMPTDDGQGGGTSQPPSGPGMIGWGLSVVIIALLTTFLLLRNRPKTREKFTPSTNTEQVISPSVQNTGPPRSNDSRNIKTSAPVNSRTDNPLSTSPTDSSGQRQMIAGEKPGADSTNTTMSPPIAATTAPQIDTPAVQPKKGKGMKGLNDSDYRIVPKTKN